MSNRGHGFSEDVEDYGRPSRRNSRTRSKQRPAFEEAVTAVVTTVDRGRFTLDVDGTSVYAVKARPLGRKGIVVGDLVRVDGDVSGAEGSLARIVEIEPRSTVLRRSADDDDPFERVIVANADQLVIVCAVANPEPRDGFIERALVAAFDAGVEPLLVLTKSDLASPDALVEHWSRVVDTLPVQRNDYGDLAARFPGHRSVLLGHSGVGKSTMVNALVPEADRATGQVNAVTGRGRHTSTSAYLFTVEDGWIVDTPGVRSLGLAHVPEEKRDLDAWL